MRRLILVVVGISLIAPIAALAQVKITVPAPRYSAPDKINAKVENTGKGAITFCVEIGQTSSKNGEIEPTPIPFWVQSDTNGKWGTLIIGPDVGSFRVPVVLEAGESNEFPFRLNDSGKMRLRLHYWRGSFWDLNCKAPPKHPKLATSVVFTIN